MKNYIRKEFIILFFISLICILSSFFIGSYFGFQSSLEEANETLTDIKNMRNEATPFNIFTNNFLLDLLSLIPALGPTFCFMIWKNTGNVLGQMYLASNRSMPQMSIAFLTNPIAIIEIFCSCLMLAESLTLTYFILKDIKNLEDFKLRLKNNTWLTIIIVGTILFLSAVLEYLMIQ